VHGSSTVYQPFVKLLFLIPNLITWVQSFTDPPNSWDSLTSSLLVPWCPNPCGFPNEGFVVFHRYVVDCPQILGVDAASALLTNHMAYQ